jgi:hypothetical protein
LPELHAGDEVSAFVQAHRPQIFRDALEVDVLDVAQGDSILGICFLACADKVAASGNVHSPDHQ